MPCFLCTSVSMAATASGGGSDCCVANGTPGCSDPVCQNNVCNADPFCCDTEWDQVCADGASMDPVCLQGCEGTGGGTLMSWAPFNSAGYDVAMGQLNTLPFQPSQCVAQGLQEPQFFDNTPLPPGEGLYFLMRGRDFETQQPDTFGYGDAPRPFADNSPFCPN